MWDHTLTRTVWLCIPLDLCLNLNFRLVSQMKLGGQGHWTSLFPFPVWTHREVPFLSFLLLFIHLVGKGMSEGGWIAEFRSSALMGLRHSPNSRNNSNLGLGAQINFFSPRFHFLWCFVIATEKKLDKGHLQECGYLTWGCITEEHLSPSSNKH